MRAQTVLIAECLDFYEFAMNTDFLEEYEKMNLACNRSDAEPTFKAVKRTIMPLMKKYEGSGVIVEYITPDRFLQLKTLRGNIEVGFSTKFYNKVWIYGLCFYGKMNGEYYFRFGGLNELAAELGEGQELKILEYRTKEEFTAIFDFLVKWLNKLADYLAEKYEGNIIVSL